MTVISDPGEIWNYDESRVRWAISHPKTISSRGKQWLVQSLASGKMIHSPVNQSIDRSIMHSNRILQCLSALLLLDTACFSTSCKFKYFRIDLGNYLNLTCATVSEWTQSCYPCSRQLWLVDDIVLRVSVSANVTSTSPLRRNPRPVPVVLQSGKQCGDLRERLRNDEPGNLDWLLRERSYPKFKIRTAKKFV